MIPGLPQPPDDVRFSETFLQGVICELRFAPMLRFAETERVSHFNDAVTATFPSWEQESDLSFGVGVPPGLPLTVKPTEMATSTAWTFLSGDKNWRLRLTAASFALETQAYVDFEGFLQKFLPALGSFGVAFGDPVISRIGVRKINLIPEDRIAANEALRDVLVPLHDSDLKTALKEVRTQVVLTADPGAVRLAFGTENANGEKRFRLDIDRYAEIAPPGSPIPLAELQDILTGLSGDATDLFRWAISEKLESVMRRDGGDVGPTTT